MAYNIQVNLPVSYTGADSVLRADLKATKVSLQATFSEYDSGGGEKIKLQESKDNSSYVDIDTYTTSGAAGTVKDVIKIARTSKYLRFKTYQSNGTTPVSAATAVVLTLVTDFKNITDNSSNNIKHQITEMTRSVDGNMPTVELHDKTLSYRARDIVREAWDYILNTSLSSASSVTKTAIATAAASAATYGLNIYPSTWLSQMKNNSNWFVNGVGTTVDHIVLEGFVYTFSSNAIAIKVEDGALVKTAEFACKAKGLDVTDGTTPKLALNVKISDLSTIAAEKISGIS